ncbi:hypothetical protein ABW21_db0201402 [Orbilia brochopaga]|nr:hypothetical protein ABW21_db0201402 [Drechslerella brochopaga]
MAFGSRFHPKPLPGTALYSTTTNRSGPVLRYDDQSGALYTEGIYRSSSAALKVLDDPGPHVRERLLRSYRRTDPDRQEKQNKSLFTLCREVVLQHAESLTPDVLTYLPWHYGKILWGDLVHSTADSFTIFKNFCEVYGREPDFDPGYTGLCKLSSSAPKSRLVPLPMSDTSSWSPAFISPLASTSMAWIINLTLSGPLDVWELAELSGLSNLVSLTIKFSASQPGSRSLGRVFKNWVANKNKLDNLRVLGLVDLPDLAFTNDAKILTILDGLPKLKLIELLASTPQSEYRPTIFCGLPGMRNFGIDKCGGGWQAFCGLSKCDCRADIKDNDILASASQTARDRDGKDGSAQAYIKMQKVVDFLVEKEKVVDGKRRVLIDVFALAPGKKPIFNRRVSFFRMNTATPQDPPNSGQPKIGKKRRLSETEADEGATQTGPTSKKAYKVKARKKQDIGSLLDSFM